MRRLVVILVVGLILGFISVFVPEVEAADLWYLRDQNTGIEYIGNNDNSGKSIYCPATDDCKIVYYDNTNGDLKFFDCDDANCYTGTATTVDSTGNVGDQLSIHCPSATDCKIAYIDETNTALLFYDCDNATCSSGTKRGLDGDTGGVLSKGTACSTTRNAGQYPQIFCPTAGNCKIAYSITGAADLYFADCDDATCSDGTVTIVDVAASCVLTGCITSGTSEHVNLYCPASDDCKIVVKDGSANDLRFEDCDTETCSTGTSTNVDGGTTCALTGGDGCSTSIDVGKHSTIFCPSSTNCKIAYATNTNTSIRFADCDNSACSSGTVTYLDGETGCSTGCASADAVEEPSIYCVAADDCKISYHSTTNRDLRFIDCTNDACDAGTYTLLDGSASCVLTNCGSESTRRNGEYSSVFCPATDDCKIAYHDFFQTSLKLTGDLKFADCSNAACSSGTALTIDGNKMINGTAGAVTVNKTFGGTTTTSWLWVTDVEYPTNTVDGSLGPGTYTFQLVFTNSITAGTLTWNYEVGYCTIASDCTTRTAHVTSANQSFTSATTSPQNITVVASSSLTVPAPAQANWLYILITRVSGATGTITIDMNNAAGGAADTYIDIPALSNPTPATSSTSSSSASSSDYRCKDGWARCINMGPALPWQATIISGNGRADKVMLIALPGSSAHNLNVSIDRLELTQLIEPSRRVPFPWQQGLNTVSDVFEIKSVAALNGLVIKKLEHPVTLVVPYDPIRLFGLSPTLLRMAVYDDTSKVWQVLDNYTVLSTQNRTIANTTKVISGYVMVVYPAAVWKETSKPPSL